MQLKKQQYMPQPKAQVIKSVVKEQTKEAGGEHSLRGTFASVMMLGGILIVTWVGVFLLYLARN